MLTRKLYINQLYISQAKPITSGDEKNQKDQRQSNFYKGSRSYKSYLSNHSLGINNFLIGL